jgi:N-acetylmuramoyl-L-alanine amidase
MQAQLAHHAQKLAALFAGVFVALNLLCDSTFGREGISPQAKALSGPVVTQIVLRTIDGHPHLVIDASQAVRPHVGAMLHPRRLLLDFAGTRLISAPVAVDAAEKIVKEVRFGAFMQGQGRVIIELSSPAHVDDMRTVALDCGGSRLIIRLQAISGEAFARLAQPPADDIITGSTAARAQGAAPDKPVIVLDPGHGGIDSGAAGPGGELEKALVLSFAHVLREKLEKTGRVQVIMTRTADVFVPLRDRVRIARQAKAALFVSLHADALPDESGVRGASVYILSDRATDERAAKLAERENKADLVAGIDQKDEQDDVADILFDLARRETRAFSNLFARNIVSMLPRATPMHKTPLRGAGFRVLRAPDVPSALIELGYLTTAEEARMMMTEEWRQATSTAMADAIERFVAERVQSGREKP